MKKNNLHSLKRVFGYTKKFTPLLVLSSVLSAASVALSLYSPVLIGDAIDLMIVKNVDFAVLSKYLAVIGALTILSAIALFGANAVNNRLAFRVVENIRNDVITKLQKLSLGYLDGRQTGEIVTNMVTDAEIFSDGVLVGFTQIFTGAATIIGTVIFMFMYSKAIAAAVIIISPLSLLVAKYITKKNA
jgi:ATP-binding cassette subfamily B protein